MTSIEFKIDGNLLANQPSSLEDLPSQPHYERLPGGAHVASPRKEGDRVVVTWGPGGALVAAVSEIRTALGSPHTLKHEISWLDPDRGLTTRQMFVGPLKTTLVAGGNYAPVTLVFTDRPA